MSTPKITNLKQLLITRRILYWDDTVIMIMTKRACFRFYGDEKIAYYTAHETKGWAGIDEDGILELLTSDTWVMHDHNTINYNKKFHFNNLEPMRLRSILWMEAEFSQSS